MSSVLHYHDDGANRQTQAALAMFQCIHADGIESSWSDQFKRYEAEIQVARWENCREQGYVLRMRSKNYKEQLNIAFFEHRNTDNICAVKWKQLTINSPTIDTMSGDDYTDKFATSFDVPYGQAMEMGKWLNEQFEEFWDETTKVVDNKA